MSKYSQLPRDTLTLLTHRAHRSLLVQEYVNWAGNALVDGFDSPSLSILAGLDYGEISQVEAPDYFLKAVKELKLPIPDSELALGNWHKTDSLYRKLGLSLPDEKTMLGQHLDELAEQIKEGVIDPVVGLDRIYKEVVLVCMYGWWETEKACLHEWNGGDWWKWEELQDSVYYDEHYQKRTEPNQKNDEIIAYVLTDT